MRKFIAFMLVLVFMIAALFQTMHASANDDSVSVSAHAAALIDVDSGRILFEKNADEKMKIASITKIMTTIIALENSDDLQESVVVSENAFGTEGSTIFLEKGEKIPLHDLLYGLMLRSGNDAAVAIAEHVGGSVEGFAFLMNEKAELIGMENTHFTNPHGLDDSDNHYSTARDMAKLSAYALKNDTFRKIVSTKAISVPWEGKEWDRRWYNKNKFLSMYPGANGVKTGYTKKAGRTLVASAERYGRQLATVTLNASSDWNDSAAMMEYGFKKFTPSSIVKNDQSLALNISNRKAGNIIVLPSREFSYPLMDGEENGLRKEAKFTKDIEKIRKSGVTVGVLQIFLYNEKIGEVPLVTKYVEDEQTFFDIWQSIWTIMLQGARTSW